MATVEQSGGAVLTARHGYGAPLAKATRAPGRTRRGDSSGVVNGDGDSPTAMESKEDSDSSARDLAPNPSKRWRLRALGLGEKAVEYVARVSTRTSRP